MKKTSSQIRQHTSSILKNAAKKYNTAKVRTQYSNQPDNTNTA